MKRSKEELIETFRTLHPDDESDEVIKFVEDLDDSYTEESETPTEEWEEKVKAVEDKWRKKYIERFYSKEDTEEELPEEDEEEKPEKKSFEDLFE